jgi:invasion protein IalB
MLEKILETWMRLLETNTRRRWLVGALMLTTVGSAVAQQQPRKPAAAPSSEQAQPAPGETPQRTTATYDDWVMQCETQAGSPPQKACQITQTTLVQGKNQPFSLVAIPHPTKGQPVRLVIQVPVNASFATNVRIRTDDADPGIAAPFARCVPAGCFAEFDLKDDYLKKLRALSGLGKFSFADAGGHDVSIPLSFKGFVQAYDALLKE